MVKLSREYKMYKSISKLDTYIHALLLKISCKVYVQMEIEKCVVRDVDSYDFFNLLSGVLYNYHRN